MISPPAVDFGRLLPHRHPFVLIDRVIELEPGVRGRAIKRLSAGDALPLGGPCSSPALLVEACAQLLAIVSSAPLAAGDEEPAAAGVGYLAGVDSFNLEHLPRAGDTLTLDVCIVRRFGPLLQAEAKVELEGRPIGGGRLTVSSPRPNPA